MKPEQSKGPEYDQGYEDGWRQRGVQQLVIDLREAQKINPEDIIYLTEMCKRFHPGVLKLLKIEQ